MHENNTHFLRIVHTPGTPGAAAGTQIDECCVIV